MVEQGRARRAAEWRIDVPWQGSRQTISVAAYEAPRGRPLPVQILLAHGAGAPRTHPFMIGMAQALALRGLPTALFNFPYSEAGRRLPDREPLLLAAWSAAVSGIRERIESEHTLVIGGKSLGGRMAGLFAARGLAEPRFGASLGGILYLSFPLQPRRAGPDAAEKRIGPLLPLAIPQLFVQGSQDPFGGGTALGPYINRMPNARLVEVPNGNHSLERPKRDGVALLDTLAEVSEAVEDWIVQAVL